MVKNQIVCVSDVSIGYGSPQIPKLVEFLSQNYDAEAIILEPYDALKPAKQDLSTSYNIKTIPLSLHPHTRGGRKEFIKKASEIVEQLKPDVLVICATYSLPVLFQLNSKPKFVIYYYLESIVTYGRNDIEMNKKINQLVDLIIFTEENRAVKFGEMCGFQNIPFCIVYNCVNDLNNDIIPYEKRNGKIIYQGTIRKDAAIDYYFNKLIQSIPIDLYGNIDRSEYGKKLLSLQDNVKYHGYVDSEKLSQLRKFYIYSIVIWLPVSQNNLYASPNKFFESIASGVPPITAPHPQCKAIVNRYSCGIVMNDWDFDSFIQAIKLGQYYYHKDRNEYENMVQNCMKAVKEELTWEYQMKKLKAHLKPL
jgi:glycosyltransferase involved in cell wall biosynthesis